ncbi:exonuclease [Aureococcus anophagefferens]|uniref:Exonuclease n=1 Tax=Aureococcus anophagefferens TaxID=44056 RepID=A0ABR1G9J4_AURAN
MAKHKKGRRAGKKAAPAKKAAPKAGANWDKLKASLTKHAKPKGSKHAATDLRDLEAAAKRSGGGVTDFRTKYSGVRARDLKARDAVPFAECQRAVASLLEGKVLVGHALHNDLKVLLLPHPRTATRDTASWPPLMRANGRGKRKPRKLRDLVSEHLGRRDPGGRARLRGGRDGRARPLPQVRDGWEADLVASGRAK